MNIRAFRLLRVNARKPRGARASVIARSVAQRAAVDLSKIAEHQQLLAERFERLHGWHELESGAFRLGHPVFLDDSVRHIDEPEPDRRVGGGHTRRRHGGDHGIEQRQRHCGSNSSQKHSAIKSFLCDDHDSRVLLIVNCGLSTIASINAGIVTFCFSASRIMERRAGRSAGSSPRPRA